MLEVSIIIVNYNTKDLVIDCIRSVINNTKAISYEIILVDNASTDGSVENVKEIFPSINIISSSVNLGFGRANNLASQNAKGEFLFFLNSDTILVEDSISKLYDFFISNENEIKIGALGCILVDKTFQVNGFGGKFPTCKEEMKGLFRTMLLNMKLITSHRKQTYPLNKEFFEVDYVIGADLMMRSSLFKKLNGFDPSFFMYYEETDLQKRMSLLNLKAFIYTKTRIIHLEDGSGKLIKTYSNRKRIIIHTSRNIYLKKNDSRNYNIYVYWDKLYLFFSKFNKKYSFSENKQYSLEVKKTHT